MTIQLPPTGTIEVAPSILSADFANLGRDVAMVEPAVNMLHIDVMDGHFVPNITIGPLVVKALRPHSKLFFDVHLMISDAPRYAPEYVKAGADGITFHLEAVADPAGFVADMRKLGVSVGVTIKPGTPVELLRAVVADVDMVLLMAVEPGFGGQKFMPESIDRCRAIKAMLRPDQRLEVDGGIYPGSTGPSIIAAGADTLVAGNAIFASPDPLAAIKLLSEGK
ncbi:MAG: ribulose-phosphate 3-epimerase [Sedimentisphaerales bacterium]|nr:ribulose-phosphate 3-epimerase [Sedimentisphaerales bacterium]MBN2842221.1 ribulose-phosphate 3-epimerase [Sedimentisphaerales bacterium]